MRPDQPPTIRLVDYRPHPYPVSKVHLTFGLSPEATVVTALLDVTPTGTGDLIYDGIDLELISLALNGTPLAPVAYRVAKETLTIAADQLPREPFQLTVTTRIAPAKNTALEGLYMSKGMYCTQCEAEGFRKITYFPDRPDVMATYTVRIEGDLPVLLSNGNLTDSGKGWAEWHDPWPKPAYLFALVAGDLVSHDDHFTTQSGRKVDLKIFVRPGDEDRCAYAMDALIRSMRWDETEYGREYDLDLFMIVAVDDFNMGAMENKGLNVFNSKYVLASPETATDRDYEFIEGIIAHEYFHNWTGNRITCRDWFQLCLKEGLTVFRDQQFSASQRSAPVKRIADVQGLRANQFREDAGPLAHPVRPEEYIEINNFYTTTVYEKGAEVIGMLRTLVGADAYRTALDLYFERHDGQACTIEDWIKVFEDATSRDLSHFAKWYSQAGTPKVSVAESWDGTAMTLTVTQTTSPTPGQPDKAPLVIPLSTALLWPDGSEACPTQTLELTKAEQSFRLTPSAPGTGTPVPSINRGFSAPVILETQADDARRRFLLAHDTDPFNRWDAGRTLLRATLVAMTRDAALTPDPGLLGALLAVLDDPALDPAFKGFALSLPSIEDVFDDLIQTGPAPDPLAIRAAIIRLDTALACRPRALPAHGRGRGQTRIARAVVAIANPAGAGGRDRQSRLCGGGQYDRNHNRPWPSDHRRSGRSGARPVLRHMAGRSWGPRQMVLRPGRYYTARNGRRGCPSADRASGFRLENTQPRPLGHWCLCYDQPRGLPPGGWRGLPAAGGGADDPGPAEPDDRRTAGQRV